LPVDVALVDELLHLVPGDFVLSETLVPRTYIKAVVGQRKEEVVAVVVELGEIGEGLELDPHGRDVGTLDVSVLAFLENAVSGREETDYVCAGVGPGKVVRSELRVETDVGTEVLRVVVTWLLDIEVKWSLVLMLVGRDGLRVVDE